MRFIDWLSRLISGEPHFRIGREGDWYMLRWFLIPRNRWLNVYLHKFLRDDDDRALHDHPWWFVSIVLRGSYIEYTPRGWAMRHAGGIAYRPAEHRHRVELLRDRINQPVPCWTLVITGPKVREWGFWCPRGFVPWRQFVAPSDSGQIGNGCDQ